MSTRNYGQQCQLAASTGWTYAKMPSAGIITQGYHLLKIDYTGWTKNGLWHGWGKEAEVLWQADIDRAIGLEESRP